LEISHLPEGGIRIVEGDTVEIQEEMIVVGMGITETEKIDLGQDRGIGITGGDNVHEEGFAF
jgi:hypothetical protein